ncbi:hypothetical protein TNCV_4856201 [Trichonephila clavipes]|nr:hypothetical protein TNCV_4856201 [Trichonephila clavipes]
MNKLVHLVTRTADHIRLLRLSPTTFGDPVPRLSSDLMNRVCSSFDAAPMVRSPIKYHCLPSCALNVIFHWCCYWIYLLPCNADALLFVDAPTRISASAIQAFLIATFSKNCQAKTICSPREVMW